MLLLVHCCETTEKYLPLPGFTFLVPAHLGTPEGGRKMVVVVVVSVHLVLVGRQEEHPAHKNSPDRGLRSSPHHDPDLG